MLTDRTNLNLAPTKLGELQYSIIPVKCGDCSRSYAVGDAVVLRSDPDATVYTVVALIASLNHPDLVTVRHPDGPERTFAKSQLRPHEIPGIVTPSPVKREGYF
jgi:hypothetical protein